MSKYPAAYIRRSYVDADSPGDISLEAQRTAVRTLAHHDGHNGDVVEYNDRGVTADVAKASQLPNTRGSWPTWRLAACRRSTPSMSKRAARRPEDAGGRCLEHLAWLDCGHRASRAGKVCSKTDAPTSARSTTRWHRWIWSQRGWRSGRLRRADPERRRVSHPRVGCAGGHDLIGLAGAGRGPVVPSPGALATAATADAQRPRPFGRGPVVRSESVA